MKLSLKDYILIVFKLLELYVFFLVLEAITIAAVNCNISFTRESSVTCNGFWERIKMVEKKNGNVLFKISFVHKLSHKELLYWLRI